MVIYDSVAAASLEPVPGRGGAPGLGQGRFPRIPRRGRAGRARALLGRRRAWRLRRGRSGSEVAEGRTGACKCVALGASPVEANQVGQGFDGHKSRDRTKSCIVVAQIGRWLGRKWPLAKSRIATVRRQKTL